MGVHGLWKLLEAAGKPVPLETLENKVLAVDVSIWLHQMMKGFQDSRGAPVPNAHLLGLFHRVCKLLFYRIKPVFVFDGGVPLLKKQTIAARKNQKKQASKNAAEARDKLLKNLVKRKAVRQLLQGPKASDDVNIDTSKQDDIFHLPPMPVEGVNSDSEDEPHDRLPIVMDSGGSDSDSEPESKPGSQQQHGFKMDLHTLDVNSEEFLSLPPDVRHDILSELKETRKQNSWGRIHEMPEESGDFSCYQLGRLLKRHSVQVSLEKAEKEMGGKVLRMNELQELMEAQGVNIIEDEGLLDSASHRIASDSSTRYVLCKEPAVSQGSGSSQAEGNVAIVKENSLYDEQAEFIAQMAENMLQKLHGKDDKHLLEDSETKPKPTVEEVTKKVLEKERSVLLDDMDGERHKILADSWSSDEDVTVEKEQYTSYEASLKEKNTLEGLRLTAHKRQAEDYGATSPASKSPKLDVGNSNSFDESPTTCILQQTSNPPQDFASERTESFKPPKRTHLTVVSSETISLEDIKKGDSINTQEISFKNQKGRVTTEDSDTVVKSSEGNKQKAEVLLPEIVDIITADASKSQSMQKQHTSKDHITGIKKTIEVVINPGDRPKDDLFADIFSGKHLESGEETSGTCTVGHKRPIEIVIQPSIKPDNDDIFADIFKNDGEKNILEPLKAEILSDSESESLDKSINPDEVLFNVKAGTEPNPIFNPSSRETVEKEVNTEEIVSPKTKPVHIKSPLHDLNPAQSSNLAQSDSFISSVLSGTSASASNWNQVEANLEAEQLDLQKERGRQERLAASITDQMCIEAQELLQLFGLPYVVAPMEAEAQCAFLDAISLTEGSITDDSDIWLFGGKKVYKNFFNQKKHVLQFTSSNINHYFKLTREQLIQLALLVGSDYTCGIQGVGPVTALEIVAAFHTNSEPDPVQSTLKGLSKFKDWWTAGRPHQSNRLRLLDKKLKNVNFLDGFPSRAVVEAYLNPSVEDSQETFSWGTLDLPALREYARSKFGWPVSKTDEIILPVSKRWTARNSQRSIDSYFNFQPHLVEGLNKMSKRVQKAVNLMEEDADSDNVDDPDPIVTSAGRKRQSKKGSAPSNGEATVKRQRRRVKQSSDSELDDEVLTVGGKLNDQEDRPLPVRAPTVPRERSSTGVKRVGRKLMAPQANRKTDKTNAGREHEKETLVSTQHTSFPIETKVEGSNVSRGPVKKKIKKVCQDSAKKASTSVREKSSVHVRRVRSKPSPKTKESRDKLEASDSSDETQLASKKTSKVSSATPEGSCGSNSSDELNQPNSENREDHSTQLPIRKQGLPKRNSFTQDESYSSPGCSYHSSKDQIENVDLAASEELTALSEMNWEEDPWSIQEAGSSSSKVARPKLFFGGIRANKPKKPARPTQVSSVEAQDTRGVRPGWVTRERLESRTAWIESVRSKKEEAIPQRQQDQRAMEEAKMKAISIVKASEARQASRLLGRNPSKRGKGKKRPAGKILPQHNLSESSSDE